jgi:thioredoxin 1
MEVVRLKDQISKTGNKNLQSESKGPVHVTDATFESIVKKNSVVLIDFWAGWCPPCKALAPTIEKIAQDYSGRVLVGKLDVDKNPATANRFGVSSIPTLIVFKNCRKVGKIVGYVPGYKIETALERNLTTDGEDSGLKWRDDT